MITLFHLFACLGKRWFFGRELDPNLWDSKLWCDGGTFFNVEKNELSFDPPCYIQRYASVAAVIKDEVKHGPVTKVVDFGCAELAFFIALKNIKNVEQVVAVDIDESVLKTHVCKVEPTATDQLYWTRSTPLNVKVFCGSVDQFDPCLQDTHVVVAIELIEHLYSGTLSRLPGNIFGQVKPRLAIFTTPNSEFNVLFPDFSGLRHWDHKFEWTRLQFEKWAVDIINTYPEYTVKLYGIGPGPEGSQHLGCCSQMAVFRHQNYYSLPAPSEHVGVQYTIIREVEFPFFVDTRTVAEKIEHEVRYRWRTVRTFYDPDEEELPLHEFLKYVQEYGQTIQQVCDILKSSGWSIRGSADNTVVKRPEDVYSTDEDLDDDNIDYTVEYDINLSAPSEDDFWCSVENVNIGNVCVSDDPKIQDGESIGVQNGGHDKLQVAEIWCDERFQDCSPETEMDDKFHDVTSSTRKTDESNSKDIKQEKKSSQNRVVSENVELAVTDGCRNGDFNEIKDGADKNWYWCYSSRSLKYPVSLDSRFEDWSPMCQENCDNFLELDDPVATNLNNTASAKISRWRTMDNIEENCDSMDKGENCEILFDGGCSREKYTNGDFFSGQWLNLEESKSVVLDQKKICDEAIKYRGLSNIQSLSDESVEQNSILYSEQTKEVSLKSNDTEESHCEPLNVTLNQERPQCDNIFQNSVCPITISGQSDENSGESLNQNGGACALEKDPSLCQHFGERHFETIHSKTEEVEGWNEPQSDPNDWNNGNLPGTPTWCPVRRPPRPRPRPMPKSCSLDSCLENINCETSLRGAIGESQAMVQSMHTSGMYASVLSRARTPSDRGPDSGYLASASLDLTDGTSDDSLSGEEPPPPVEEPLLRLRAPAPPPPVENGDVANNNRDGEGNNVEGVRNPLPYPPFVPQAFPPWLLGVLLDPPPPLPPYDEGLGEDDSDLSDSPAPSVE